MVSPNSKGRKAPSFEWTPRQAGLFWEMACEFGLQDEARVKRANSLLSSKKYVSFVKEVGSWTEQQYQSPGEHFAWNQLAVLFIKYPFSDPSLDREAAAMKKFYAAEHRCRRYNAFFRGLRLRNDDPRHKYLNVAKEWIRSVIGDKPNLERIYELCGFGPGASVGVHGNATNLGVKASTSCGSATPSALSFVLQALAANPVLAKALLAESFIGPRTAFDRGERDIICLSPGWLAQALSGRFALVQHNKITCVPKNAKTDRTIAIEPLWNGFLQKGVDLYMRDKLRRFGIDLSRQDTNQELARLGSLHGSHATIDLSAASDSMSIELIRFLLPPEWFSFLNAIRSPSFKTDEGETRYEKFASMGNGFCFPLETLVFGSMVVAANKETGCKSWSVYGDDIIVESSAALLVIEYLKTIGFKTNVDKTFVIGPFRESCGADYYAGVNVRPIYLDGLYRRPHELYFALNSFRKVGLLKAWKYIYTSLPKRWQSYVRPEGLATDDSAIDVPMDVFMGSVHSRWNRSLQAWTWRKVAIRTVHDPRVYRPDTFLMGAVGGFASPSGFTLRRETRTCTVRTS